MPKVFAALVLLPAIVNILKVVDGVTPEEADAFCSIAPYCPQPYELCSRYDYFKGGQRYTSFYGEYCDEKNGTITMIDLKSKKLKSIDTKIGKLTALTYLDLSHNSLTAIPNNFKSLKNLTEL